MVCFSLFPNKLHCVFVLFTVDLVALELNAQPPVPPQFQS